MRVLHCPLAIAGNPPSLARAERELGLQSWSVAFTEHPFGYPCDEILFGPRESGASMEVKRWRLLRRALRDYDVVHYNFGQTIFPFFGLELRSRFSVGRLYRHVLAVLGIHDLTLLRRAGKAIVVTFQGDDARQGDASLARFEICIAREVGPDYYTAEGDHAKRKVIETFDAHADRIFYLNPDLGWVLPTRAKFLPYGHIDLREWAPASPSGFPSVPVVVHAPSHRQAKGTRYIVGAVERLQREGVRFEFVLIEGLQHEEARAAYRRADLLVDQLLAGWYGGLAVELMALGKPVICYLREDDLQFIPEAMRRELPIINATPYTLYEVLKEWLTCPRHRLSEAGERSRKYVERWHDRLQIAARLKTEYEAILSAKGYRVACQARGRP